MSFGANLGLLEPMWLFCSQFKPSGANLGLGFLEPIFGVLVPS